VKLFELIDKHLVRLQQKVPEEQVVSVFYAPVKRFESLKIHRPISCSPEALGILRMFRDVLESATLLATLRSPMLDPCKSE
jgi:hypothetical protein